MNKPSPILSLGTRGWRHDDWCGSYYPDDLPPDWQLDFYANEFRQVLLPFADWSTVPPEDAEGWADATDDAFRFFVELPGAVLPAAAPLLDVLGALAAKLAGVCVDSANERPELPLAEVARLAPLYRRQGMDPIAPYPAGVQWLPLDTDRDLPRLLSIPANASHTPMQLRGFAEALQASAQGAGEVVVFLAGEPPAVSDAPVLQQLGELLGGQGNR